MAKGTQAQLDALKSELWRKCGTRNKLQFDIEDLTSARDRMSDLHVEFMQLRLDIINTMDSYNQNGNEWVGVFFDEMDKSSEYVDTCYWKYEAVYTNLKTLLTEKEDKLWEIKGEISSLESKINSFEVIEEEAVGL